MSNWNRVVVNTEQVIHSSPRAKLIQVPGQPLKFWFPLKLIRFSNYGAGRMELGIPETMDIKLLPHDDSKLNTSAEAERQIKGSELVSLLKNG